MHQYMAEYKSPLGALTLASDGERLTGLWNEGQKYFGGPGLGEAKRDAGLPVFAAAGAWLDAYFAGEWPEIAALPLAPAGSAFRQAVWGILREIPRGEVITYGEIAAKMAARMGRDSMSGQAVGGAVGHNPISIIIPCHRVIGTGGDLTGYAGGIDKKRWLLAHEGVGMRAGMPQIAISRSPQAPPSAPCTAR